MVNNEYYLLNERSAELDEVIKELDLEKLDTDWAKFTNQWAIDLATDLTQETGQAWYYGLLQENLLGQVLLPIHHHDLVTTFYDNTTLAHACKTVKRRENQGTNCVSLITYLKDQIKLSGFSSRLILAVINGDLRHVDGLHRMIALQQLLDEGYNYTPVETYLLRKAIIL